MPVQLARVIEALNAIGLPTHAEAGASVKSFVPGIRMVRGELVVSPEARVSALLHEAVRTSNRAVDNIPN